MEMWRVHNPWDQKLVAEVPLFVDSELESKVSGSVQGFDRWKRSTRAERATALRAAALRLRERVEAFAKLIVIEAGKPITLARGEVLRGAYLLESAAAEAERWGIEGFPLDAQPGLSSGLGGWTFRVPRGPVLGVSPFNFPLNLALHKIAPALACGASVLLKPSPRTPLTALNIAALFEGLLPEGVLTVLPISDSQLTRLAQDARIAHFSFTGSTSVGAHFRSLIAGRIPVTLELGGDAWVYVDDSTPEADLADVAKRIAWGAFQYAGQSCISVQNIAVHDSKFEALDSLLQTESRRFPAGDPNDSATLCGPVISTESLERLRGIHPHFQSFAPLGVTPFVIRAERQTAPNSELFGPGAWIHRMGSFSEFATRLNESPFGLQAGMYTRNLRDVQALITDSRVGGIVVNDAPTVRWDRQPYGGSGASGQGREGLVSAMEEFSATRFIAMTFGV